MDRCSEGNGTQRKYSFRAPNSVHAVINSHAASTLKERFGRESVNVPNVMDFDQPFGLPDIGSKGFKTVIIENQELSHKAVSSMAEILYNPALASEIADYNFQLGKKYFSYDTLREKLEQLIRIAVSSAGA